MNAIEVLKESWQEYIARRKLERTPVVTLYKEGDVIRVENTNDWPLPKSGEPFVVLIEGKIYEVRHDS